MIASAHIAAGAAVTILSIKDSRLKFSPLFAQAFVLGLSSHAILDAIPHTEYNGLWPEHPAILFVLDCLWINFVLWLWLRTIPFRRELMWMLGAGIAGASLPDVRSIVHIFGWHSSLRLVMLLDEAHEYFHSLARPSVIWGMPMQIVVIAVSLYYLIRSKNNL